MGFLSGLLSVAAPIAGVALGGPLGGLFGKELGGKLSAAIGSSMQSAANAIGAEENYKHQLELLKQLIEALQLLLKGLNDWNELMWNKLNEYNSPANLRQLYEEAGLNPAYFLGEGNSVAGSVGANTISVPSVPTPAGNFQALGSIGEIALLALIDSLIHKNESEAGLSASELKTLDLIREYEVEYKKALAGKTEKEITLVDETINKVKADKAYVDALTRLSDTLKKLLDEIIKWMPLLNQAQINEVQARIKQLESQSNLNDVLAKCLPVLAKAAMISADAALKLAAAALQNADTNERLADSTIEVNNSLIKVNNSLAELNDANTGLVKSKTKSQDILNEVDNSTKGTRIFKENTENTVGTVIELIDNFWNTGTKIVSDVATGGATTVIRGGAPNSAYNPIVKKKNNDALF